MNINGLNIDIITYLSKSFTGKSNEQIKQAERKLESLQLQQSFLEDLISIIQQNQLEQTIKMSAATYLKKYSQTIMNTKQQQKINIMSDKILKSLSLNISIKLKRVISNTLENIIRKDTRRIIRTIYNKNLIKQLGELVLESHVNQKYIYLVFFGKFMVSYPIHDDLMSEMINNTFQNFVQLNIRLLDYVNNLKNTQNAKNIEEGLELIKEFALLFKLFFKIDFNHKNGLHNKLNFSERFQLLVMKILSFNPITTLNQTNTSIILLNTTNSGNYINATKSIIISIFQDILKYRLIVSEKKGQNVPNINLFMYNQEAIKPVTNMINGCLQAFLKDIYQVLRNYKYYQFYNTEIIKIIEKIIRFFSTFTQFHIFQEFYFKNKKVLFYQILLPLFQFTPDDKTNFQHAPQQFINNLNTIIDKNLTKNEEDESKNIIVTFHMIVSELLSKITVFLHGSLFQLIGFCIKSLELNTQNHKQRQIFLMVLCILSYNTKMRLDIQYLVKKYLESVMTRLSINSTNLDERLQTCFILMNISRYQVLFHQFDEDFSTSTLSIAMNILKHPEVNQSIQIVTIQLLFTLLILETKIMKENCLEISKVLQTLLFKQRISPKIFDVLFELYRQNADIFHDSQSILYRLIQKIILKIENEVYHETHKIIISKCWNILKQILHQSQEMKEYFPIELQLEKYVSTLYKYLQNLDKIQFEDDIIIINIDIIKRRNAINADQFALLKYFPKIFIKDKFHFNNLFEIINLYVYWGSQILATYTNDILSLIDISLKSIFIENKDGSHNEADSTQGALTLQNLIIAFGDTFTLEVWQNISTLVLERLINGEFIKFAFFRANLYGILLIILIKNKYLIDASKIEDFLGRVLLNKTLFQDEYSIKLYVICMIDILKQYKNPIVLNKFIVILDSVIQFLQTGYLLKNKLTHQEDNEQEEMEIDQQQYLNSVKIYTSQVKKIDEYEYFKKFLNQLKCGNYELYCQTINSLDQSRKSFLSSIYNIQRFQFGLRQIVKVKKPWNL